jgi:DNA primase
MRIPQEKFDEIAQANDIVDVIASYTQVKKRGKSFLALCPFHPDKNPSLNISQQKQVYHCFSCGASGNVFTFIQEYEKIPFMEAAEKLAMRAGIELNLRKSAPDTSNEISRLFEINKATARFYYNNLMNLSGYEKDFVWDYIKTRDLKIDTLKKFGIGYALKEWDSLLSYFSDEKTFSLDDVEKSGLILKSDKKANYYDRFRGRLIFPIFSENDKVVGFGARKLYEDDPGGKYINSPETRIYSKSRILYGLNFSKEYIRSSDFVILVEGYLDVMTLVQAGINNVVASSGTALTTEQVQLISRYTKNVVVIYDADLAGIKAAKRSIELILEAGLDLKVVTLPEGEDPDSIVRTKGKAEFEKHLNTRKSFIEFLYTFYETEKNINTVEDKTEFVEEIMDYISKMTNKIMISFYIKDISKRFNIYESILIDYLKKARSKYIKEKYPKSSVVLPVRKSEEKKALSEKPSSLELELLEVFIHGDGAALDFLSENIDVRFIKNKAVLDTVQIFLEEYHTEGKIVAYKAIDKSEDINVQALIAELSIPKHEISKSSKLDKNSILVKAEKRSTNYLRIANDIINKFQVNLLEEDVRKLIAEGKDLNKILELRREIDKIKRSNGR